MLIRHDTLCLSFDQLTLKVCDRSGVTWSYSPVVNLIEIEQFPAELFIIWQIFAPVTSRCDDDLWPLERELLLYFGRHVFKPCIKFERNRTSHCRVIDDLAQFLVIVLFAAAESRLIINKKLSYWQRKRASNMAILYGADDILIWNRIGVDHECDRQTAYVRLVAPSVELMQNTRFDTQQR